MFHKSVNVYIVGVREDINFEYEFPSPTHGMDENQKPYVTLNDAISNLIQNPGECYEGSFSSIYLSRNRKKDWNEQSFTIQASGRQAPLHPSGETMKKVGPDKWELPGGEESHRRLSVNEFARIQTFPDWFAFSDERNNAIIQNGRLNKVYKQIGNAVPIELARAITQPIADWSNNNMETIIKKRIHSQQLELFEW